MKHMPLFSEQNPMYEWPKREKWPASHDDWWYLHSDTDTSFDWKHSAAARTKFSVKVYFACVWWMSSHAEKDKLHEVNDALSYSEKRRQETVATGT